jgi:hypothetical protein
MSEAGGACQVLVAPAPGPADGYDVTIADPGHLIATRYGLRDGARIVIRPDGYIGHLADLTSTPAPYFTLLAT